MKGKYKATGCARFFLVLIILAPLAYIGASYFNGQDGIGNLKQLIGIGSDEVATTSDEVTTDLHSQIKLLEKEVETLKRENDDLQQALQDCENETIE